MARTDAKARLTFYSAFFPRCTPGAAMTIPVALIVLMISVIIYTAAFLPPRPRDKPDKTNLSPVVFA